MGSSREHLALRHRLGFRRRHGINENSRPSDGEAGNIGMRRARHGELSQDLAEERNELESPAAHEHKYVLVPVSGGWRQMIQDEEVVLHFRLQTTATIV